jgi:hypothetical protein
MTRTDSRGRKLSAFDREALGRALKIVLGRPEREDPGRRAQVERLLQEQGWFTAADFCCYCCQSELIRPRLWQPIPSDITDVEGTLAKGDDGLGGSYRAALLLKRMLAAGLSRYEPDPIRALAKAKERQRRAGSEPEPAPAA